MTLDVQSYDSRCTINSLQLWASHIACNMEKNKRAIFSYRRKKSKKKKECNNRVGNLVYLHMETYFKLLMSFPTSFAELLDKIHLKE